MSESTKWAATVDEWQASGEAEAAFCAARGLRVGGLKYWARRIGRERDEALNRALSPELRRAEAVAAPTLFGRVRVWRADREPRRPAPGWGDASSIFVVIGDAEIRVGGDVDVGRLSSVVAAVRRARAGAR